MANVKISNSKTYLLNGVLVNLTRQNSELPIRISYAIERNKDKIQPIIKKLNDTGERIKEKYGKNNSSGGWDYAPGQEDKAADDWKEIMDLEENIDFHMISFKDLEECEAKGNIIKKPEGMNVFYTYIVTHDSVNEKINSNNKPNKIIELKPTS